MGPNLLLRRRAMMGAGGGEKDWSKECLTFTFSGAGSFRWFYSNSAAASPDGPTIEVSVDGGPWESVRAFWNDGNGALIADVSDGTVVKVRGDNTQYSSGGQHAYFASSAFFDVSGNIMSLLYSTGFADRTELTDDYTFQHLFKNCDKLINAVNLILPSLELTFECYGEMFSGCASLITTPELPAESLNTNCYYAMFNGCASLSVAPDLPAMTLAYGCYREMFSSCITLESSPVLAAAILAERCYYYMFDGCSRLNRVTCYASNLNAPNAINRWLRNVGAAGTFEKASGVSWPSGESGIPSGWTVIEV